MKILIFIPLFLFSNNALSDWIKYCTRYNGDVLYYDSKIQAINKEYRVVWILANFSQMRNDRTKSGTAKIQIDCKLYKYQYLKFVYFERPMGRGKKQKEVLKETPEWIERPNETPYVYLFQEVCDRKQF